MNGDWRAYRPAIWLAMLGLALMLLLSPPYIGVAVLGGAIGAAARIRTRRGRLGRAGQPVRARRGRRG